MGTAMTSILGGMSGGASGLTGVMNTAATIGAMQKNPLAALGMMGKTMFPSQPAAGASANTMEDTTSMMPTQAPMQQQSIPWIFRQLRDPNSFINFLSKLQ